MEPSFGGKRSSGDSLVVKLLAYAFLSLSLINTVANLFLSELNLKKVIQLRNATERLEKLVKMERERNAKLKEALSQIEANPEFYKEKLIRERLLMFKEGEKVVPLPEELWYR